ncbi:32486_t:CDS:2, partial [Racocetra persica]
HLEVRDTIHNHNPSDNMLEYPVARQLTKQQIENVILMTIASSSSHEIVLVDKLQE